MRAAVVHEAGRPEALVVQDWPSPEAKNGEVLIRVKAFGLNRAELFTRNGDSGSAVVFPRVIGIECTGEVVDAPGDRPRTRRKGRRHDGRHGARLRRLLR